MANAFAAPQAESHDAPHYLQQQQQEEHDDDDDSATRNTGIVRVL